MAKYIGFARSLFYFTSALLHFSWHCIPGKVLYVFPQQSLQFGLVTVFCIRPTFITVRIGFQLLKIWQRILFVITKPLTCAYGTLNLKDFGQISTFITKIKVMFSYCDHLFKLSFFFYQSIAYQIVTRSLQKLLALGNLLLKELL